MLAIFVSLTIEIGAVEVAEANFLPCPPSILIDSPVDKTYNTNSVWLNITLKTWFDSGNVSRVVECGLDAKENTTIPLVSKAYEDTFSTVTGALLLSDLSEASHSIAVYVTYTYGTYSTSNSITSKFIILLPEPTSTPEPMLISDPNFSFYTGLALMIIFVAVFAGLIVYFKKRKH